MLLAACSQAPAPNAPPATAPQPSARRARPAFHAAKADAPDRPSEQEAVGEERLDPEAKRLFEKRMAEQALPLGPVPSASKITKDALADTALGAAPKPDRREDGDLVGATLAEGQRAMMPVTLAPGDCMTWVAQGGLGVIEVDLFLLADRSTGLHILAEDPVVGPIAVIGGHGHCFESAGGASLAAELHVAVRRGAGTVLVQAYKKQKTAQLPPSHGR
jgi:hypothetical protein